MTDDHIHQLFKRGYSQAAWKQFLAHTFAKTSMLAVPKELSGLKSNLISKALYLGTIALQESRTIAVFEVQLAKGIVLERNRVGLRNLLRNEWKKIDGAFIVYHSPESTKWRFTYVSELTGFDSDGVYDRIQTDPKRYTYVLGEGESTRTAAERFAMIVNKASNATLDDVKDAFSVEKLSKAFFDEYKKHYDNFCHFMMKKPGILKTIFGGDEKAVRDFNKKLLGRIVFLYFIQKKGWLGVPLKKKWGEGNFDFLSQHFNEFTNKELFYQEFLSPLFFDTLNTKRKNDIFSAINQPCRIPYLNGGLFEEENSKQRNIIVEPSLFKNLFDFFNQYNFTIYEDDPADHTVAVDPEMLGHIFENLLEDNKDKGAYYTPKEIVHYMCQESLIEYLTTWFEGKGYEVSAHTALGKEDAVQLFPVNEGRKGQMIIESPVPETFTKKIDRLLIEKLLKKSLSDNDKKLVNSHAEEFHQALDAVKICDPAIGSGAFPMGLLQEIFIAKQTLWHFEYGNLINFPASKVKLNIIQNSIYGVDIEKGAVDIARLRFWLSLVVDEEEPKPLPNLDYKIVVGNSLVSKLDDIIVDIDWDKEKNQLGFFGSKENELVHSHLEAIAKKEKEFFTKEFDKAITAQEIKILKIDLLCNQLEKIIQEKKIPGEPKRVNFKSDKLYAKAYNDYLQTLEWKDALKQLKKIKEKPDKRLNFFDWKLDFPEVFNNEINANPGFDIVIGNPPYGAKLSLTDKTFFQSKYVTAQTIKDVQKGSLDTFTLFIELGHFLAKTVGNLHYIVPISITSSDSMTGVHRLIEKDCSIIKVSSYSVRPQPVFENAMVNTSILYFKKDGKVCERIYSTKMYRKNKEINLRHLVENLEFIEIKDYKIQGRYPKISLGIERKILAKIFSVETKIGGLLKPKGKPIFYRTTGGRYYKVVTNYSTGSTKERSIFFDKDIANIIGATLSSNLYFWFYQIFSNNLDLKSYEIEIFRIPLSKFNEAIKDKLEIVYAEYLKDIEQNANVRLTEKYANIDSFKEYRIGKSKHIIDKIDDIIGPLYGLTKEEINFIKNYEIDFRMQDE